MLNIDRTTTASGAQAACRLNAPRRDAMHAALPAHNGPKASG